MCGRYYIDDQTGAEILELLQDIDRQLVHALRPGDVYPSENTVVLYEQSRLVTPGLMSWGFPGFDRKGLIINARCEGALDKRTFRESLLHRRCIIPAAGFYEWNSRKEKNTFSRRNRQPIFMGGCFDLFANHPRFVILTAPADPVVAPVHHRMPLIFEPGDIKNWLCDDGFAQAVLQNVGGSVPTAPAGSGFRAPGGTAPHAPDGSGFRDPSGRAPHGLASAGSSAPGGGMPHAPASSAPSILERHQEYEQLSLF